MFATILGIAIPVVIVAFAIIVIVMSYVKAPPDMAYIVSGLQKKPRIYIGKAGFKIPFFERLDRLSLGAIQIDVKTKSAVPTAEYINVRVDSTVSVRVGQSPEMIALAAQNFLNATRDTIANKVNDLLEGNIREIVGQMKLTEMVSDRKAFSAKVQDNVVPDLEKLGLEMITFNVQNFTDDNDVITNLGIDNIAQISKNAAIAKSNAEREVEIAQAENKKAANDAKVKAAEEIAVRNNDLAVKQAELKRVADTQKAQADAAEAIEAEKQRQLRDVASTNANIAKAEREAELKQKEIQLKEYELDALVRKQADAEKYAAAQKAEADLIKRQKDAEAKAYEVKMAAEAQKEKAEADRFAAEQQAAGIAAVGAAEAEAIQKKAEAQKLMGEASILEMYFQMLPKAIASASGPLANVDKITMYGEGNSAKLAQDIMMTADQVIKSIEETTGLDTKVFISSLMGSKAAQ
jgi:flotillin